MKNNKSKKVFLTWIFFGILVPCIIFLSYQKGNAKTKDYLENGKLTDCVVENVIKLGKTSSVQVSYTDDTGELLFADAILNRSASLVHVGQHIQAYVLPERPNVALVPAGTALKLVVYLIILAMALVGWAVPVLCILSNRKHKILMLNGIPGEATLVDISVIKNVGSYGNVYIGKFRFQTDSGNIVTDDLKVSRNAQIGENYRILYCEKTNGKCVFELNDDRIRV